METSDDILHLRWKETGTSTDNSILCPPKDPTHRTGMGSATFAFSLVESGKVVRPVSDHGGRFLGKMGDYKDAHFSSFTGLLAFRVDDFDEKVIFNPMDPGLLVTLRGNDGANLRQSITVERINPQPFFNLLTSCRDFRPCFTTKASDSQGNFIG